MASERSKALAEQRRQRVYAMLRNAAAVGEQCPTNRRIAACVGYRNQCSASKAISELQDQGRIRQHGSGEFRLIEIVSTGKTTAPKQCREARRVVMRRQVSAIIAIVAETAGLTAEEVAARDRQRIYIRPRIIACHFARQEGWSFPAIGRVMGRDHSTVIHAWRQVDALKRTDKLFARLFRRVEEALAGVPVQVVTVVPGPIIARPIPIVARRPVDINEDEPLEVRVRENHYHGSRLLIAAIARAYPERVAA